MMSRRFASRVVGLALVVLGVVAGNVMPFGDSSLGGAAEVLASPMSTTTDVSSAVRYDTSGGAPRPIGSLVLSGSTPRREILPLPFPINMFGTKYGFGCLNTEGMVLPVSSTSDTGRCREEADKPLGFVAVLEQVPVMSVFGADLTVLQTSLVGPKDHNVLRGSFTQLAMTVNGTNGSLTLEQPVGGELEVADFVTFHGVGLDFTRRSFQVSEVSNSATPPTFTVSLPGVTTLDGSSTTDSITGYWTYGRNISRVNGLIPSGTAIASQSLTLTADVSREQHPALVNDYVVFHDTGTALDGGDHYRVTAVDQSTNTFTVAVPGVADTTLTAGYWAYSNGVGASGVYAGETTIDGRQAFVATWYRIPNNEGNNSENQTTTMQLVIIKGPSGDDTTGWDYWVEYNYGTVTDDEDGYKPAANPNTDCRAWTRTSGVSQLHNRHECRWPVGFASFAEIRLASAVIENGITTLITSVPHGIPATVTVRAAIPFDGNQDYSVWPPVWTEEPTLGRALNGYRIKGEVVNATTLRFDTTVNGPNSHVDQSVNQVADLALDLTASNYSVRFSGEYELLSAHPIDTLIDSAGSSSLVSNSLNSTVLGRYRFGMFGGILTGFAPHPMTGTPLSVAGFQEPSAQSGGSVVPAPPSQPTLVPGSSSTSTIPVTTTVPSTTTTLAPSTTVVPTGGGEPVRVVGGDLPEVTDPTKAVMVVNGVKSFLDVAVVDETRLVVSGDGFEMALAGSNGAGQSARVSDSGRLEVTDGGLLQVSGVGFAAGSVVDIWVMSDPVFAGTVVVGADGTFSGSVPVPQGLTIGSHTVQANGVTSDGVARSLNLGIELVSVVALPSTGAQVVPVVWLALVMMLVGLVVVASRRRLA